MTKEEQEKKIDELKEKCKDLIKRAERLLELEDEKERQESRQDI